jgi:hypothetical protein
MNLPNSNIKINSLIEGGLEDEIGNKQLTSFPEDLM